MLTYLSNLMASKPTFSQSTAAPGAYRYRLTVTDAGGCSVSDDVTIRVRNFEVISLPANIIQCSGVPTPLITTTAPATYNYQWRVVSPSSSQGTISNVNSAQALFSPQVRTTYELYYVDPSSGCELTQQVTVGIAPAFQLAEVAPQVYCAPEAGVNLTAMVDDYASLQNSKWYRSLYPSVVIAAPTAVNVTGSEIYYLESSNEFGCVDTVLVQVLLEQVSMPTINNFITLSLLSNTINLGNISSISPGTPGGRLVWHSNPAYAGTVLFVGGIRQWLYQFVSGAYRVQAPLHKCLEYGFDLCRIDCYAHYGQCGRWIG